MNICIILSNITLSGDTPSLKSEKRAAWNSEYGLQLHLYPEMTPQSKRKNACTKVWRMEKLPKVLSGKVVWKSESRINI